MTMKKAIMTKKNSKKGFTLVELVIVIAILAILGAIAIPIISSTIGSAKMSVMKSDAETLDLLIAECRTNAVTHNRQITYGNGHVTANNATIEDILITNLTGVDNSGNDTFFCRTINQETYQMVYYNGHVCIDGGDKHYGTPAADIAAAGSNGCVALTASTTMTQLCGTF